MVFRCKSILPKQMRNLNLKRPPLEHHGIEDIILGTSRGTWPIFWRGDLTQGRGELGPQSGHVSQKVEGVCLAGGQSATRCRSSATLPVTSLFRTLRSKGKVLLHCTFRRQAQSSNARSLTECLAILHSRLKI